MRPRFIAVALTAAAAVVLGVVGFVGVTGAVAGAAGTNAAPGLANAKLPAGLCGSEIRVTLANGYGHPNLSPDSINYFNVSLASKPVTVDVNHDGIKDTAAVFECNDGGSVYTTELWVFDARAGGYKVLAGPLYPRPGPGGESSDHIKSVTVRGSDLVTSEVAFFPTNPACCQTRTQSTTWAWHKGGMHIVRPAPVAGTTTVKAAPTDDPGFPGATKLPSGTHVAVVCTQAGGPTPGPSSWDFLDTGYWLPGEDVTTTSPPVACGNTTGHGGSQGVPGAVTTTSQTATTTPSTSTTPTSANASPSPECSLAALTSAAETAGTSDVTGVDPQGYGCSGNWAYAGVELGGQEEVTWIFMATNGAWQRANVQLNCLSNSSSPPIPASILSVACNSN